MTKREPDVVWVSRWLLDQLGRGPKSHHWLETLLRAEVDSVKGRFSLWSRSTAGRRLREAVTYLQRQGYPVISTRGGVKLASNSVERTECEHKLRSRALRLLRRVSEMQRGPRTEQPELPMEVR